MITLVHKLVYVWNLYSLPIIKLVVMILPLHNLILWKSEVLSMFPFRVEYLLLIYLSFSVEKGCGY
jgi:hypothetical protein